MCYRNSFFLKKATRQENCATTRLVVTSAIAVSSRESESSIIEELWPKSQNVGGSLLLMRHSSSLLKVFSKGNYHYLSSFPKTQESPNSFTKLKEVANSQISSRILSVDENDFAELNAILSRVTFDIPDMGTIKMDLVWPFSAVNITVTNFACTNIQVGDISITGEEPNQQKVLIFLSVESVNVDCSLNWEFQYDSSNNIMNKIGSDGTAQIYFRSSNLDLSFAFLSQNLANFFPTSSNRCWIKT
jgi:hypothetical protein